MGTLPGFECSANSVKRETRRKGEGETRRFGKNRFYVPICLLAFFAFFAVSSPAQDLDDLDALDRSIQTGTTEQKRDALFQIRNLRSEIASRIALPALTDTDEIVRATAASAVIFLPKPEAITALAPLLNDKAEFVRKEAAYALGNIASPDAASPLLQLLPKEKDLEVKAALVVALGPTGNRNAVESLIQILKDRPKEETEFLRRCVARSIGQIAQIVKMGNASIVTPQDFLPDKFKRQPGGDITSQYPVFSAAVVTLSQVLQNRNESDDARREAAFAIGAIGNKSSFAVLESQRNSSDTYLAEICKEALFKIKGTNPVH